MENGSPKEIGSFFEHAEIWKLAQVKAFEAAKEVKDIVEEPKR